MLYVVLQAAASDPRPATNDVVAGRIGAAVFVLLVVAVILLCWSFSRQLKKVRAAREAGVYGEEESETPSAQPTDDTERHSTPS